MMLAALVIWTSTVLPWGSVLEDQTITINASHVTLGPPNRHPLPPITI
jgi:hypothetical protein